MDYYVVVLLGCPLPFWEKTWWFIEKEAENIGNMGNRRNTLNLEKPFRIYTKKKPVDT